MTAAIGIDVGGSSVKAARVDEHGKVLERFEAPTDLRSRDELLAQITGISNELRTPDTVAMCAALPGSIGLNDGMIDAESTNLPLSGIPLASRLTHELGLPATVERDSNAAIIGEARFGAAMGRNDVVLLTLGTGVGGSVLVNGELLRGSRGAAGELGHFTIDINGRRCIGACRGLGHLEAYASATAIVDEAEAYARANPGTDLALLLAAHGGLTAEMITARARAGDRVAQLILADAGHHLGVAIEGLVNIFNPEVVLIGGGVAAAGDLLLGEVRALIDERLARPTSGAVEIRRALLEGDAGVIGASAIAHDLVAAVV